MLEAEFGELRAMLARPQQVSGRDLLEFLARAHDQAPHVYEEQWLPYLERADLPLIPVGGVARFMDWAPLLPGSARLRVSVAYETSKDEVAQMLDHPMARQIQHLTVSRVYPSDAARLFSHPTIARIPGLAVRGFEGWMDAFVEALEPMPNLRSLALKDSDMTDETCAALAARADALPGLVSLRLPAPDWEEAPAHRVTDAGARALMGAWPELEVLDLSSFFSLSERGLEPALALTRLRGLGAQCGMPETPRDWTRALLGRVTHLDLSDLSMPRDVRAFLDELPPKLVYLKVARCGLDADDLAWMTASPALRRVRYLCLHDAVDWSNVDQVGSFEPMNAITLEEIEAHGSIEAMPALEWLDVIDYDVYPVAFGRDPASGEWEPRRMGYSIYDIFEDDSLEGRAP